MKMNRYIESDIRNGLAYLKSAIMNIIYSLLNEEISEYYIGFNVSVSFIINCILDSGLELVDSNCFRIPNSEDVIIIKSENGLIQRV